MPDDISQTPPRPATVAETEWNTWQLVTTNTRRLRVPGGWLYKVECTEYPSYIVTAVALHFVEAAIPDRG